jgi:imidazole glycerol-phosphate synthase subunit HisH
MRNSVTVVDYGASNMANVIRALEHVGASVRVADNERQVANAGRLVLPGVGAFGKSMEALSSRGLDQAILEHCKKGNLLLGICLGMQMLMGKSWEFGEFRGLNLIEGDVKKFSQEGEDGVRYKVPHVGWSDLDWSNSTKMSKSVPKNVSMYFVHSYFARTKHERETLAICRYAGQDFSAVVGRGNVIGCQFHPEKSGKLGLRILKNFCMLDPS